MTLHRMPVALALLSIAIVPITLAAQADTAKATAKKSTTTSAAAAPKPTTSATTAAAKPTTTAQAPAAKSQTAAATVQAKCKDGMMYSGTSRQGACSSHGGVAEWITPANSKSAAPKDGLPGVTTAPTIRRRSTRARVQATRAWLSG